MKVQAMRADGTIVGILVRYSPHTGRLYTTERVLEVAKVKAGELCIASAAFDIYRKDWCVCGICEDADYHTADNLVGSVPYSPRCWNYL